MIDQVINFADKVSEQNLFVKVKMLLSFVFVSAITSYFFKKIFFDYDLLSFDDYNGYYKFLIEGHFLLPFSLFYIIWQTTDYVARIFFTISVHRIARKLEDSIKAYVFSKHSGLSSADLKTKDQLKLFLKTAKVDWMHELLKESHRSAFNARVGVPMSPARTARVWCSSPTRLHTVNHISSILLTNI